MPDDEKDLLTANFNFDYETKFSDLGINIDASFSTASSTATHIYGDDTGRSGFTDLSDFTISSESLTNLLSNNSKTLEENEIAIIKNKNDTLERNFLKSDYFLLKQYNPHQANVLN